MQYLVLHDKGPLSGISIEPGGKVYKHRIACWAIMSGKQMDYVHLQMGRHLNKYYMSGAYQQMALYALTFDELKLILSNRMGVDDEERYLRLQEYPEPEPHDDGKPSTGFVVMMHMCEFLIKLTWGCIKLLGFIIAIPFFINFFKHRK